MKRILEELRSNLKEAVRRNEAEALLFSGGLDTSILAFLLPEIPALSVRLEEWGDDFEHARRLSQELGLEFYLRSVSTEEAFEAIPEVIKIRRSFDPALPNDLAIYFALKLAKEKGIKKVMTGDGADELFAGYSYMFDLDLEDYIPKLAVRMSFSANEIGSFLEVEVKQPFLDKEVIDFALSLKWDLKIREKKEERLGKWILRKAFEPFLPQEIIWQDKRPIEVGTGFSKLREIIESKVKKVPEDIGIEFLSKEHFYYYQIYRDVVGEVPKAKEGQEVCPSCGTGIGNSSFHCRVCGWSRNL